MEWTLPLDRVNLAHVNTVGGKAARLGALLQAGFNVPAGFVVTADAFSSHYPLLLADAPPPPTLAPDFVNALKTAFLTHFQADDVVAVRSSAIDEDGAGVSYAGQHATYYYITAARLEQAVIDCWMSLWSPQAMAYRDNWDEAIHPMAVIVQRLVRATRSGVCFSRDPLEPEPGNIIIEASWGLGAALVDGRVQPDRLKVDPLGNVSTLQIGDKQVMVPQHMQDAAQGRLDPVPEHLRTQSVLTIREAVALHEVTEQIETLFNEAVDVEWAFDDSHLHILQARPITTVSVVTQDKRRLVLFKPVAENFSEPLTPLTVDLLSPILPRLATFLGGRLYLEFDWLKRFLPLRMTDAELVDVLLLRRSPATIRPDALRVPAAAVALLLSWLTHGTFWSRSARIDASGLARFVPWLERLRLDRTLSLPAFIRRSLLGRHPWAPAHQYMLALNVSAGRYFLLIGLLRALLNRWAPTLDTSLIDDIVHDDGDMWSKQMVAAITSLATLAGGSEECRAMLLDSNPAEALRRLDIGNPLVRELGSFINTFGHRGARELDLSTPRWREDVSPLLTMIRNQMLHGAAPDHRYSRHLLARDELRKAVGSGLRWRVLQTVLNRIRYYISLRENTRHYHTMIFDAIRRRVLDVEQDLLHAGTLRCRGDIFFLTWSEVEAAGTGRLDAQSLSRTIRERRILHRRESRARAAATVNIRLPADQQESSGTVLRGQCASPGWVEGIARVVLRPDHAQHLLPGDILIAPYTDPTWTPLFPSLGGIVVGIGSYLSHAGTIAREYRIPCLVDVHDCISRIRSGQHIRLSATDGFVEILEAQT